MYYQTQALKMEQSVEEAMSVSDGINSFVLISYDGQKEDMAFTVEKKSGNSRNWEDESEWEFLGVSGTKKYKRYHLSAAQARKFYGK